MANVCASWLEIMTDHPVIPSLNICHPLSYTELTNFMKWFLHCKIGYHIFNKNIQFLRSSLSLKNQAIKLTTQSSLILNSNSSDNLQVAHLLGGHLSFCHGNLPSPQVAHLLGGLQLLPCHWVLLRSPGHCVSPSFSLSTNSSKSSCYLITRLLL